MSFKHNEIYKAEAQKRRNYKDNKLAMKAINMDSKSSGFLPTMTYMALKEDAPNELLHALCRYIASTDRV